MVAPAARLPGFWQHISARLLVSADSHTGMWVQFRALFPYAFADTDISGAFGDFYNTLASISGGANFAALPLTAQAVQAAKFLRRTRAPPELSFFLPESECLMDILRLADPSRSDLCRSLRSDGDLAARLGREQHNTPGPNMSDVSATPHVPNCGVWSAAPTTGVHGPGYVAICSSEPLLGGIVRRENRLR